MRRVSPFLVPVGELLDRPGHSRPVTIETPVGWGVEFSAALPSPLVASIELTGVPGGIVVRGDVELSMRSTCVRCLAETDHVHRVGVDQLARRPDDGEDDDDDLGYVLDGDVLDLEPMLRDEVLLALPVLWRCQPDCPGLGETPQNDLNTAAPGQRSDSPFAALRELLDTGE